MSKRRKFNMEPMKKNFRTRERKLHHKDRTEKHNNDLPQDPKENFKRLLASLIDYKKTTYVL